MFIARYREGQRLVLEDAVESIGMMMRGEVEEYEATQEQEHAGAGAGADEAAGEGAAGLYAASDERFAA